jgi:hypothetical protein
MATSVNDPHAVGAVMTIKLIEAGGSIRIAEPRGRGFFRTWLGFFLLGSLIYGGWAEPEKGYRSRYEVSGRHDKVGIAMGVAGNSSALRKAFRGGSSLFW